MSLDPSEFGTPDLEIAAVVHVKKQSGIKSKKKRKNKIYPEKYSIPDYSKTNYGLGF